MQIHSVGIDLGNVSSYDDGHLMLAQYQIAITKIRDLICN
jgi:hypothetical protein